MTEPHRIKEILASMSLEDKIRLCSGEDFWHTKAMEQHGIPATMMSDGPHGLRKQTEESDAFGINDSHPATCFPAAVTAGATWDRRLYAMEGMAIGKEALAENVDVVLGPGCNIKRNPLCGRNFEYLSEDPYLAGMMADAFIEGQQSTGVASSVKHFAVNNQEYKRQNGDSQLDDRTLREIYLAPFELAVRHGKPRTVMCSYNKINGVHASDNQWLLTDVLRNEWGFEGLVVTDWGALNDRMESFKAGCDLNMPGGSHFMEKKALEAVRSGDLPEEAVDTCARRVIELALSAQDAKKGVPANLEKHHNLALTIAEEGAVMMKNDDYVLPAAESDMVLIGSMAKNFRYQGAGSSHINPTKLTNLADALPNVPYCPCCDEKGSVTEAELKAAEEAAAKAKVAVVVAGLPDNFESEGFDRDTLSMPEGHLRMIDAVVKANPNTVVVLLGGSVMELPWADKVKAILYMGLSGQAGGQACANLLTGKVSPSGKLTETWPLTYADVASSETFGKKNVEYREGIYVGYRHYDKAGLCVRFPFGHGLSYSTFAYSNLRIADDGVAFTITNTGSVAAAEVAQLYIAAPQDGIHRPLKELKGFRRVQLEPGESVEVVIGLDWRSFAIWNGEWVVPAGTYQILIGSSSQDIRLRGPWIYGGEKIEAPSWQAGSWYENPTGKPSREGWERLMGHPVEIIPEAVKGQFTMDNSCIEMKEACFAMRVLYSIGENTVSKSLKCEKDYSDPEFRTMMLAAADCPLRMLSITSSGSMLEDVAEGLLDMANGKTFRGFGKMALGLAKNPPL